ncbi:MAG: hypothetical protein QNJ91_14210 [Gammaproteobacteria bacterium]|nr:hypothetical protein [Gammaproteobacteria bacterium]
MSAAAWADRVDGFLHARIVAGDDGKTFLLGLRRARCGLALAAGLRGAADHRDFVTFARYLLRQRFDCDGHALMLPIAVDGEPRYVVELCVDGGLTAWSVTPGGARRDYSGDLPLIGDLRQRESGLPGIRRRDMDRLYTRLQLPLPDPEAS